MSTTETPTWPDPTRSPTPHPASPPTGRRGWPSVVAALSAVALFLVACSSGGSSAPASTAASGTHGSAPTDTIVIRNFAFSPATDMVAAGATVTVDNEDQVTHTLTATKGAFDTGQIPAGQSKTFTAPSAPGTYPYICSIHQYMSGVLVVSG